ncbi:CRISPR-associated ring nuclease Csm6 [Thalassotalea ponticola]|uniref:CRISPR-associated ring nuclease Csm6 n=1 Tax=Thalassotalea ponticola TaxID=1523392 RepID=UPI0025B44A7F|nr:CRISPR-associated ring nuclease Csm6 [Thalassotalea ponticola]MDN3651347.1 CRISPR-associated ring nuclease Csm6 [Thalassotalea ponticola]
MKHALLAVTGLSPQVVTETLYALHKQGQHIDEIYIITTREGKKRARLGLITDAYLQQLLNEYQMSPVLFDESHIYCVENDGVQIDDALTEDDHCAIADFITRKVREFTSDPNVAVHASIAGGRKTMTFYLGYAMSLFGRQQDTLSHVLVSEGYEGIHDFYYPTKESKTVKKHNAILDAKEAEVTLADIPFVRMRKEMPDNLLHNQYEDFSSTVSKLNLQKENIWLVLDLSKNQVTLNDDICQLTPNQMATYCWFISEKQKDCRGLINPRNLKEEECKNYSRRFLKWALKTRCDNKVFEALGVKYQEDFRDNPEQCPVKAMDYDKFERTRTTLNKTLKNKFGCYLCELIGINKLPFYDCEISKHKRVGILVAAENITIKE